MTEKQTAEEFINKNRYDSCNECGYLLDCVPYKSVKEAVKLAREDEQKKWMKKGLQVSDARLALWKNELEKQHKNDLYHLAEDIFKELDKLNIVCSDNEITYNEYDKIKEKFLLQGEKE